ncbi:transposase family protein [Streptomyces californicus]|uniref:transposase family protein n=1 Tax=Streptomyces californicus TaxID=67351 RepID=UPI00378D4EC3
MIHAGGRHPLGTVLAPTACAPLAGARSLPAVGEWVADASPTRLERLGGSIDPPFPKRGRPAESTIRRLSARVDADALDHAVGVWLAASGGPGFRASRGADRSRWSSGPTSGSRGTVRTPAGAPPSAVASPCVRSARPSDRPAHVGRRLCRAPRRPLLSSGRRGTAHWGPPEHRRAPVM